MLAELLFFLIMLLLFFGIFFKVKDLLHPAVILSFVFLFDILFYIFMKFITKSQYSLDINILYFALGVLIFYIGCLIGSKNQIFDITSLRDDNSKRVTSFYKLFIVLEIIVMLLYIFDIIHTANVAAPSIFNYITATRSYVYNEKYFFQIARTISFSLTYFAIYQLFSGTIKKNDIIFLLLQILISLIYMLFHTARTVWFLLLVPCFFIIILVKYNSVKVLLKYCFLMFILLFAFTMIVCLLRNNPITLDYLRIYLCSGMVQFSEWMKNQGEKLNGMYTFRILFAILKKFKLYHSDVIWVDQSYLNLPTFDWKVGNVFTFYHGYAQDFGIIYALFIQFLNGVFNGYIYCKARKYNDAFYVLLYAIFALPLMLQFFSDQYASEASLWIQIIIIIYIVTKCNIFYNKN